MSKQRILFVGNSLSYRGGGLDTHYSHLVRDCEVNRVVKGGATLKRLLSMAEESIRGGSWDIVVLQDDLPETTVEDFMQSVRDANTLVREGKARPVLLMTWPYERLAWIDTEGIVDAHRKAAKENLLDLAPAGLAWKNARSVRPELELYDEDREHPCPAGSFLAACSLAALLGTLQSDSVITAGAAAGLSEDAAVYLAGIAADTARDFAWYA